MRFVYLLSALATLALAVIFAVDLTTNFWTEATQPTIAWGLPIVFLGATVAMIIAFLRNYRGSWPFFIGSIHVVIALICITVLPTTTNDEELLGIVVFLMFLGPAGALLLHSGHRLHRLTGRVPTDLFD